MRIIFNKSAHHSAFAFNLRPNSIKITTNTPTGVMKIANNQPKLIPNILPLKGFTRSVNICKRKISPIFQHFTLNNNNMSHAPSNHDINLSSVPNSQNVARSPHRWSVRETVIWITPKRSTKKIINNFQLSFLNTSNPQTIKFHHLLNFIQLNYSTNYN